jgi:AcrR family transcriptional regulator
VSIALRGKGPFLQEHSTLRRTRGRPRNPETFAKLLTAAKALLAQGGYDALTFEALAQATGVSRGTIYRRWPTKAHIAADVIRGGDGGFARTPVDEGFAAQVRALVNQLYSSYRDPAMGPASIGLFNAYFADGSLRPTLQEPLERESRAQFRAIVDQAKVCGTARRDIDADALFDILTGSIIYRMLFSNLENDDRMVDEICNIVVGGVLEARA